MRRLRAVQHHRAPHHHRPVPSVGRRLPPPAVLAATGGSTSTSTVATRKAVAVSCDAMPRSAAARCARPRLRRCARPRRRRRSPRRCCAKPSRSPRPASIRPDQRPLFAHVTAHIFEALYRYDYLARPVQAASRTPPAAMPEISRRLSDLHDPHQARHLLRRRSGVQGQAARARRRRTTSTRFKRFFDPAQQEPALHRLRATKASSALDELRQAALKARQPFDYDAPIEGLRALDRYTLAVKLAEPRPRFLYILADCSLIGAVAREVVEHYGDEIDGASGGHRPVPARRSGGAARRSCSSATPTYREECYDGEPAADDAEGQALLRAVQGQAPAAGRPRRDLDHRGERSRAGSRSSTASSTASTRCPTSSPTRPCPTASSRRTSRSAASAGSRRRSRTAPTPTSTWRTRSSAATRRSKVALRRAIALAYDSTSEIRIAASGQAIAGADAVAPGVDRLRPGLQAASTSEYDPRARQGAARHVRLRRPRRRRLARAARRQPAGARHTRRSPTQRPPVRRAVEEDHGRDRHPHADFSVAQWPEQLKAGARGQAADVGAGLDRGQARRPGRRCSAALRPAGRRPEHRALPAAEFDALYEHPALPDGPERDAHFARREADRVAYMPYKMHVHRMSTDMRSRGSMG